jgi:Arc/MetJ family transcription regulator
MTKRLVDVDDELLQGAADALGTKTMKETVNRALEEATLIAVRRRHAARLTKMEGIDLAKPRVMRDAWR